MTDSFVSLALNGLEVLNHGLIFIKKILAFLGAIVILAGAVYALFRFIAQIVRQKSWLVWDVDHIRINLGKAIALGLEFIIAADIIETTTAPDYYSLGILGLLVIIRTFLNYFLNKDLNTLIQQDKYSNL